MEMTRQIREDCAAVEAWLDKLLPPGEPLCQEVVQAMRYSLLGGGKRVRAILALEFCRLCGAETERAMPFACAVEMIHAYSLIHDDLPCMDDDDLRRGKPSCHIAFGEATALLAGDALLTSAFETAASPWAQSLLGNQICCRGIHLLSRCAGNQGMVGGQIIDLASEGHRVSWQVLEQNYKRKTGALLQAAAGLGCLAGGATQAQEQAAADFALNLGLAFQIVDDILDEVGDPALLGKPVGSDVQQHKSTYVTLFGLQAAREQAAQLAQRAKEQLAAFPGDRSFLEQLTDDLLVRQS